MKAWLGDLVLNAAVARELMKKRSERQNVVTNHNVCVSNEFLYNRANSILNLPSSCSKTVFMDSTREIGNFTRTASRSKLSGSLPNISFEVSINIVSCKTVRIIFERCTS